MADTSTLKVTLDKASYVAGDAISGTVAGNVSRPIEGEFLGLTANVRMSDGSLRPEPVPAFKVTGVQTITPVSVESITDASGRKWTCTGLTFKAVA